MRRRGTWLVVGALALLAGCGGAQSEGGRVRSVVTRYFAGLASGNGAEVCSLLTGDARVEVIRAATVVASLKGAPRLHLAPGCPGLVDLYHRSLAQEPGALQRIRATRIGNPTVAGASATVRVQEPGGPTQVLPLLRTAGGWRIGGLRLGFAGVGSGGPAAVSVQPPPATLRAGGGTLARFYLGRTVVGQSGCLACHVIGVNGNVGPGPDLTHVGSRLDANAIERALIDPTEPMPSFRHLPRAKLRALVTFLSLLRG